MDGGGGNEKNDERMDGWVELAKEWKDGWICN